MPVHYLETGSTDPCYNLAFEQYVLEQKRSGDWLILWQNDRTVVVGLNQVAVIPVRRDKHDLVWRNAHQVSRSGYDQILLQHDEAKVATSLECKNKLFVEMYEIAIKMYEMVLFITLNRKQ